MTSRRKSRTEAFLADFPSNWPAYARIAGLAIGFVEMGSAVVQGPSHVSAEVLAFAGGLIVAPNIAGAQSKRNDRRDVS